MGKLFFSRDEARCGDVIPKYIDGKYQLFYLKGWKDPKAPGVVFGWHRMESTDLVSLGDDTPTGVRGGTGDLIRAKDGTWHLFACIFPEGKQFITHYISADGTLDHWLLQEEDTFGPDGVIYGFPDWRDPRIVYDEEKDEYRMYLAGRVKAEHGQTGCVGLCVSKDLKHWEYREPAYAPMRFSGACECPDYFVIGDWEYLVFSSYTTLFGNYYVKKPLGSSHWEIPSNHRLDSRAFYAAKTAGDGKRRFLFGWNPTKERDIFGFWPDKLAAKDYRTWDWGGDMVIHEVTQLPDGDLALSLPAEKEALFSAEVCRKELVTNTDSSIQVLETVCDTPDTALFTAEFSCDPKETLEAGFVLHMREDTREGYYIFLEPRRARLTLRSWLRFSEDGGKTFPYDVELEVPVRKTEDGLYRLQILTEGEIAAAYVNGEAAMSFRMCDLSVEGIGRPQDASEKKDEETGPWTGLPRSLSGGRGKTGVFLLGRGECRGITIRTMERIRQS